MTNSFARTALAWLPLLVLVTTSYAQSPQDTNAQPIAPSTQGDPNSAAYHYEDQGRNFSCNVPINEISIHAYRHFRKNFPSSVDERWNRTSDRLTVSFQMEGSRAQALYDTQGNFLYSLKYCCSGSVMDREVRQRVARFFPGYATSMAVEISDGNKTMQIVTIRNRLWVKTIQIVDGEIKVTDVLENGGA